MSSNSYMFILTRFALDDFLALGLNDFLSERQADPISIVVELEEKSKGVTMSSETSVDAVQGDSYFDGGLIQLIGWNILGWLVTLLTLGICFPWSYTMIYRWEAEHTVINGHRMKFDGTAVQLFGMWIKWFLLSIITLGIYGFWVSISLKKWRVAHTRFVN